MAELDQAGRQAVRLALGRIFRLASRPEQPGDIAEYERARAVIRDTLDPFDPAPHMPDSFQNWTR